MSIVSTNSILNYSTLRQNLNVLNLTYPFLNIQIIGNSILGKNLYVIKLGRRKKSSFLF